MSKTLFGLQLLIALSAIRHGGRHVPEGKAVAVDPAHSKPLLGCGAAREATAEEAEAFLAEQEDDTDAQQQTGTADSASASPAAASDTPPALGAAMTPAASAPPAAKTPRKTAPAKKAGAAKGKGR
jgi:hypothetical protein